MTTDIEEKAIVKQDKSFLEYPDYVIARYPREEHPTPIIIEKENGKYRLSTSEPRYPDRSDKIFLYYLLMKLWKNKFRSREIETTRYRITKDIFGKCGKTGYDRVMAGLERWKGVTIKFDGVFYDGDNYTTRLFGIIEDVILDKETGKLLIRFNKQYLEQLKNTQYYRKIDWKKFKRFKKDLSARLYEILSSHPLPWKIEVKKLAEKLTLQRKYPSAILQKIEPAIDELKKVLLKQRIHIEFSYHKNDEGNTICIFFEPERSSKESETKKVSEVAAIKKGGVNKSLNILLRAGMRQKTAEALSKEHSFKTISETVDSAREAADIKNPAGLIISRLNEIREKTNQERLRKQALIEAKKKSQAAKKEKKKRQKVLETQAREFFNTLPEEEKTALVQKAKKELGPALERFKDSELREKTIMYQIEKDILDTELEKNEVEK